MLRPLLSSVEYQVVLEGVVGKSFNGDASIDDVEIENGQCAAELACNFESDYCGYYNVKELDQFDWERG